MGLRRARGLYRAMVAGKQAKAEAGGSDRAWLLRKLVRGWTGYLHPSEEGSRSKQNSSPCAGIGPGRPQSTGRERDATGRPGGLFSGTLAPAGAAHVQRLED